MTKEETTKAQSVPELENAKQFLASSIDLGDCGEMRGICKYLLYQEAELARIKTTEQKLRQCVEYYANLGISFHVNDSGVRREVSHYAKEVLKELYPSSL